MSEGIVALLNWWYAESGRTDKANPRPSPGRKRVNRSICRRMRTHQEIRENTAHVAEHGYSMVRGRRRKGNIPDVRWDYFRPETRSWKEKKLRKQWMKHLK